FTLIEILLVTGLLTMAAAFGLAYSLDFYRGDIFWAETRTVLSLLNTARSRSQNNVNSAAHGLKILAGSYVLFQGPSYTLRDAAEDEVYPSNQNLHLSGMTEVVYSQLSAHANVSGGVLVIADLYRTENIFI